MLRIIQMQGLTTKQLQSTSIKLKNRLSVCLLSVMLITCLGLPVSIIRCLTRSAYNPPTPSLLLQIHVCCSQK